MRSFQIVDVEQRSVAWFSARLGRLTSSTAGDMLSKIKTGEAAARRDLRVQLAVERLTGQPQEDGYISKDMARGMELENDAFAAYEAETGVIVERTGFLRHDSLMVGASLDGHVGDFEGVVEIKVPKSATHMRYLKTRCLPPDHEAQIRHHAWLTGCAWVDFVSFDPRFPDGGQLFIVRVTREQCRVDLYEALALQFLEEVDRETETVRNLCARAA